VRKPLATGPAGRISLIRSAGAMVKKLAQPSERRLELGWARAVAPPLLGANGRC